MPHPTLMETPKVPIPSFRLMFTLPMARTWALRTINYLRLSASSFGLELKPTWLSGSPSFALTQHLLGEVLSLSILLLTWHWEGQRGHAASRTPPVVLVDDGATTTHHPCFLHLQRSPPCLISTQH